MNFKTRFLRNIIAFSLLFILSFTFFYKSLDVFFVQDDFILINYFTKNNFLFDFKNAFAYPSISHWRPLHNLYFLISGNLFGRSFLEYHAFTLIIHIASAFMIFKVLRLLTKNANVSLLGAIIYAIHPSHFVSIFWISGSAVAIGFLFLISSFYLYLKYQKSFALVLFGLSFLASEAMAVGAIIFISYEFLNKRKMRDKRFQLKVIIISLGFLLLRFLFLTPDTTFKIYPLEISKETFVAFRYYFLRTLGFAETSQDFFTSIILILWLATITTATLKIFKDGRQKFIWFFGSSAMTGLFPFVLIPSHLSPHYLNISIWSFASVVSFSLLCKSKLARLFLILIFAFVAIINIQLTYKNNWVIKRNKIAKQHINKIENENPSVGTLLTFDDSLISSSSEAYFALGTGKAIDFWFAGKNYKTCFSAFENCLTKN